MTAGCFGAGCFGSGATGCAGDTGAGWGNDPLDGAGTPTPSGGRSTPGDVAIGSLAGGVSGAVAAFSGVVPGSGSGGCACGGGCVALGASSAGAARADADQEIPTNPTAKPNFMRFMSHLPSI
jgi:hypothetical protein